MKKTKFYQVFHEAKDPLGNEITHPFFGITYQINGTQTESAVFGVPTNDNPDKLIQSITQKAFDLYHQTEATVHCILLTYDLSSSHLFSILTENASKKVFRGYDINLCLINIANVKKAIQNRIDSQIEIPNAFIIMYAYLYDTDELITQYVSEEQLRFLNDDWRYLLSDPEKQKEFITYFMKNLPL